MSWKIHLYLGKAEGTFLSQPHPSSHIHTHTNTELCGSAWTPRGGVTDTLLWAEADIHSDSDLYTTLTLQVCCIKLEEQEQLTFCSADSVKICSGALDNTLTTFTLDSPHTSTHQQVFTGTDFCSDLCAALEVRLFCQCANPCRVQMWWKSWISWS